MQQTESTQSRSWLGIISYIIASLFLLYEMAVQVSPSVMVPQLMGELHITSATLGFMASTYFWSYTIMQIPVGLLYDRFPAKYLLMIAVSITTLGILFFATTHWVSTLALGRFLMGFGSAFAFVGVLMVAARWFSRVYFALLVGIAQLLAAVGAASGEGPLSLLVNSAGWRHAAMVLSVAGFILFLLVVFFMRRHPAERVEKKRLNAVQLWESLRHVLGMSQMWWIALYAFFSWGPIAMFTSMWGVPYLMQRFSVTNTVASWVCAMTWALLAITSPVIGGLSRRFCALSLMRLTAAVGIFGGLGILYWPGLSLSGAYLAAAAIGVGSAGQILTFELARQQKMRDDLGFSISFINMGVVAGGAILQPLAAWLLHSEVAKHTTAAIGKFTTPDFQYALFLVPLSFMFCLLLSYVFIRRPEG
jgi:predicted MFS family arabinose efflux permease